MGLNGNGPTAADLCFSALRRAALDLAIARELAADLGRPDTAPELGTLRASVGDAYAVVNQALDTLSPHLSPRLQLEFPELDRARAQIAIAFANVVAAERLYEPARRPTQTPKTPRRDRMSDG